MTRTSHRGAKGRFGSLSGSRALSLHVGTTGRPKGVVLTHRNLSYNVEVCQRAGEFDHRDSFLCLLPFFHTYAITGTILLPLLSGSKMVLVDRFQPMKVMKLIEEHTISVFLAIPSMYRVLAHTRRRFQCEVRPLSDIGRRTAARSLSPRLLKSVLACRSSKDMDRPKQRRWFRLMLPGKQEARHGGPGIAGRGNRDLG